MSDEKATNLKDIMDVKIAHGADFTISSPAGYARWLRYHEAPVPMSDPAALTEDHEYIAARRKLAELGRGIVDVSGVPQRPVVMVGYDDPTGDDVAADVAPGRRR